MRDLPIEIPPAARKFKSFRLSQRIQEKPLNTFHNDPNYVSDSQGSHGVSGDTGVTGVKGITIEKPDQSGE